MSVPSSDGELERLRPDVVHFATQQAVLTDLPSIYQPHDLLHVHFPEMLRPSQVRYRDVAYRRFIDQASVVVAMTNWGREDLVRSFGVPPSKIEVVPWAPVAGVVHQTGGGRRLDLPERYALYPAQTWPHKNHRRLIEAIATLRDRGIRIPVVLTGRLNAEASKLQDQVGRLRLKDLVHFLGYVDDEQLTHIYRQATALVFPSLFEGWGLPVVEAFSFGLPVTCSDAAALPEVAAGAALLFDPSNSDDIASKLETIWTDDQVRAALVERGHERARCLSWAATARQFDSIYGRVKATASHGRR